MKQKIHYDILIPAYNAGSTLNTLLAQIFSMADMPRKVMIVDDGSDDETARICRTYDITLLQHTTNMGKGRALKTGFEVFLSQSEADYLLCMDADLQHPVGSIPAFLKETLNGGRYIIGNRERSLKTMPAHRILSNSITSAIISLMTGQRIKDSQCGFRLLHRDVLTNVSLHEDGFQLESEMLVSAAKNGIKIDFVAIPTIYSNEGSHMSHIKDTFKFIRLMFRHLFK